MYHTYKATLYTRPEPAGLIETKKNKMPILDVSAYTFIVPDSKFSFNRPNMFEFIGQKYFSIGPAGSGIVCIRGARLKTLEHNSSKSFRVE